MLFYRFYCTYIAKCADGSLYVGQTQNLEKRLKQHNGVVRGGAKYTKGRTPIAFVYVETSTSRSDAMRKEQRLKKLSHAQKEKLCSRN